MATAQRTITYGQEAISFEVTFSTRKTLDIAVHPDQAVIVKAPQGAALDLIDRRVAQKARWILKQQDFFSQFTPFTPPRKYVGGETHLYLGRQYRLKLHKRHQPGVKLIGQYIHIYTATPDNSEIVCNLLWQWYLTHARDKFQERLDYCFERFASMGCDRPTLMIRQLSKRWGSLTSANNLLLNRDLIRAPRICIDYVITHELCHLKHFNHSPQFYNYLDAMMPDWQQRKLKLEQMLV